MGVGVFFFSGGGGGGRLGGSLSAVPEMLIFKWGGRGWASRAGGVRRQTHGPMGGMGLMARSHVAVNI